MEPFEPEDLTKDGRLLEVEVWTQSIDCGGQAGELVFAVDVTERRAFGQALIEAIGGEQRRIAQEMHDGLGQELTGLALSVRALANRAQKERDAIPTTWTNWRCWRRAAFKMRTESCKVSRR